MKLYATTTSERASKGQGGNYLDIEITGENKIPLWNIKVNLSEWYELKVYNLVNKKKAYKTDLIYPHEIKGEKKKDEHDIDCTCKDCPHSNEWGKR